MFSNTTDKLLENLSIKKNAIKYKLLKKVADFSNSAKLTGV